MTQMNQLKYLWSKHIHILANSNLFSRNDMNELIETFVIKTYPHISKFKRILQKWHKWSWLNYSWLNLIQPHCVFCKFEISSCGKLHCCRGYYVFERFEVMQNLFNLLFLLLLFTSNMRSNTMIPKHCNTQQKIALFQKSNDHIQCVKKLMILVSLNERI